MSRGRRIGIILAIAAAILVVAILLRVAVFPSGDRDEIVTASGTVEATDADLGFQIAGRVESVEVEEGDPVESGDLLATIDRTELRARRRMAEAQAAAAGAALDELTAGFRPEETAKARAALEAARSRRETAARDLERAENLRGGGAISQQELDHARTAFELAEAEVKEAREALMLLERGPRRERIEAQKALLAQARATIEQIDALLDYSQIRAPFAGVVTVRHREPGEAVAPGSPVLTLMRPDDRWVRIYVPAPDVGRISLGQPASITSDAYEDRSYDGRVMFISNEAEFTPRNVQTAEERVKLVYRVKVRVEDDTALDLKPGLAADVRLEVPAR